VEIPEEKKCENGETIGIDMAFHGLAVLSTGQKINAPAWFHEAERCYAHKSRLFSRTQKDSHRREKARKRLAREAEHIANQRLDYLHTLSRQLADEYETAVVEDVNMQAMARNRHWGKRVNDIGFGLFRVLLGYKMNKLVVADRWYPSSQLCSVCGYRYEGVKDLSMREWDCPECGTHHDRDVNAAMNLAKYSTTATVETGAQTRNARGEDTAVQLVNQPRRSEKSCGHCRLSA
jgi:putative transposase